jgi:hypothetical protein
MQGIREMWKYIDTYLYFKSRIYVRKVKRKLTVEERSILLGVQPRLIV